MRKPLTHGTFEGELAGFALTLIGSIAAYLFGKGAQPSSIDKLRVLFPNRRDVFYTRADALIVVFTGAILGHYLFVHRGPFDCLTSGVSFSATVKALLKARMLSNNAVPPERP